MSWRESRLGTNWYGVETRIINQAVKNNPDKFPAEYVVELTQEAIKVLRSKILTLDNLVGNYLRSGISPVFDP